jgi:hypothetical protein
VKGNFQQGLTTLNAESTVGVIEGEIWEIPFAGENEVTSKREKRH